MSRRQRETKEHGDKRRKKFKKVNKQRTHREDVLDNYLARDMKKAEKLLKNFKPSMKTMEEYEEEKARKEKDKTLRELYDNANTCLFCENYTIDGRCAANGIRSKVKYPLGHVCHIPSEFVLIQKGN